MFTYIPASFYGRCMSPTGEHLLRAISQLVVRQRCDLLRFCIGFVKSIKNFTEFFPEFKTLQMILESTHRAHASSKAVQRR